MLDLVIRGFLHEPLMHLAAIGVWGEHPATHASCVMEDPASGPLPGWRIRVDPAAAARSLIARAASIADPASAWHWPATGPGVTPPLLGPRWVTGRDPDVWQTDMERRLTAAAALPPVEQALVDGLGVPVPPEVAFPRRVHARQERAGLSAWDTVIPRRGDTLLRGRLLPAARTVAGLDVDEVVRQLEDPWALEDPGLPMTESERLTDPCIGWADAPAGQCGSPVRAFAATLAMAQFPVSWRLPNERSQRGQLPDSRVWLPVPRRPATLEEWSRALDAVAESCWAVEQLRAEGGWDFPAWTTRIVEVNPPYLFRRALVDMVPVQAG